MSRESVLGRVRSALNHAEIVPHAVDAPRAYRRAGVLTNLERLPLFENRLHEYGARVFRADEQDLPPQVAQILIQGKKTKILHPAGIPSAWLSDGIAWSADHDLAFAEVEIFDGVLTAATAAVAESGTIVLQHGPREGRRALTLLPDYHLCVLFENQIVETLPECFERLSASPTLPTTFISGPSATADIEMTRIKGVHGPRFLDVIIVNTP